MLQPDAPDKAVRALGALRRWGPTPAGRLRRAGRSAIPDRAGDRRRARHAHLRRAAPAHQRARARACARPASANSDDVAIMCRNHRGFIEATVACAKLGAGALYLNTAFAGPQITDVLRARRPGRGDLRRGVRRARGRGRAGPQALRRVERARRGASSVPTLEQLIASRLGRRARRARRERARRDPHLGHDRHAEGRRAPPAGLARAGRGAVLEDPAEGARDDDDRGAAVPLVGLRALHARPGAVLDARAAAPLRPRGDAEGGRPAPRERARGRAGDAAADPRARRRGARALRHELRCG